LLLLRARLLLLLCLLCSSGVLAPTLSAPGGGAGSGSRSCIAAYHFSNHGTTRSSTNTSAGRCAGRGRRGLLRRLRGRLGGIEPCLLNRPLITLCFVAFLLLGRLSFCGIDILLGARLSDQCDAQRER
jgi:hypothetical protein